MFVSTWHEGAEIYSFFRLNKKHQRRYLHEVRYTHPFALEQTLELLLNRPLKGYERNSNIVEFQTLLDEIQERQRELLQTLQVFYVLSVLCVRSPQKPRGRGVLVSDVPRLLAEYSLRNPLPPDRVMAGTHTKLLWECPVCGHEWQKSGHDRMCGRDCAGCSSRAITAWNNLTVTHPEIAKEYLVKKNTLPPEKLFGSSHVKVWWKCRACGHEWQNTVKHRARDRRGCPSCAHQVITATNNLAVTHPELTAEYSERNILPATSVVAGTGRNLWWKCRACGHEWQTRGRHRIEGNGCPRCARERLKLPRRKRQLITV